VAAGIEDDGVFRGHGVFLKQDGDEDGVLDAQTRSQISFFFLPAVRDAEREFDDRGGLWARLASLLESANDPELVAELASTAGRDLVAAILGEDRLADLATTVQLFVSAMYGVNGVDAELRATALDYHTLLRRVVLLVGRSGQLTPLGQHSTGLQTLALFGLFRAYLTSAGGHLLAAGLEEPEVHLSPHVARALVDLATQPDTQIIFTTHSPVISDRLSLSEILVLRGSDHGTVVRSLPDGLFDAEQLARLRRDVRSVGTEFLFGRTVLLCEGPSELGAFPEFAAKMGRDLDRLGVTLVPVGGSGFEPLLKLLGPNAFDVPHIVVCDSDSALKGLIRSLERLGRCPAGVSSRVVVGGQRALLAASGVFAWSEKDLETYLVTAGGYEAFERAATFLYPDNGLATFRRREVTAAHVPDDDSAVVAAYVRQRGIRKPELAAEAARRFSSVPDEVRQVLEYACDLASANSQDEAQSAEGDTRD
jgi:hypothetical protein